MFVGRSRHICRVDVLIGSATYILTRIHMYVSKVNFHPLYFGHLWTRWINRLSPHVHTHTRANKSFFYWTGYVFYTHTHTHTHKMNIIFWLFLSFLLLWISNCLFLNICWCHIPFVDVMVKFMLYLRRRILKVTSVNYGRYLVLHKGG